MKHNSSAPAGITLFSMSIGYSSTQTKVFLFLALFLSMLFLGTLSAEAASNHYVCSGASGNNSGSDWTNAYTDIPSTLVRGDTYYLATGSYSGTGFNTPISGTTYIYVKKATIADHGTSAGWSDSYGTGQAVFGFTDIDASNTSLHPGYIEIDGQVDYGIKFQFPDLAPTSGGAGIILRMGDTTNGVLQFHVRHCEFAGPAGSTPYNEINSSTGIYEGGYPGPTTGLVVSHCSFHGMNTPIQLNGADNALIEYNDFYDLLVCGTPSIQHTNIIWMGPSHDIILRYNKSHNYDTEGFFLVGYTGGSSSNYYNIYIYGNLFYDGYKGSGACYPRGIEICGGYTYGAIYIYNNTCADMNLACVRNFSGVNEDGNGTVGGAIRNNIGYGSGSGFQTGNMTNSNNMTTSSSSIFTNYAGKDFHLKSATAAGYTLSSPYNADMDGKTRGADGVWDLGAYEYGSGRATSGTVAAAPSNLRIQ